MSEALMQWPDIIQPTTEDCQRIFHGRGQEGHPFEHVCVDWFAPVVLFTLYKAVDSTWLSAFVETLRLMSPGCQAVCVQCRYQNQGPLVTVWGDVPDPLIVTERGLCFQIKLTKNQNHGLFLDIANGRQWVREQSKGRRVLNLFAYRCAFSVSAIAGGAQSVLNIDMSKSALQQGRENHRLNHHDLRSVQYASLDIFKSWSRLKRSGPFDLLVCDPPTFQKGSVDIERDYKKIIRRIPEFMADNADVLLCLNAPHLSEDFLMDAVNLHCPECEFIDRIENPSEFIESDPNKGLKVLHFKYIA